MAKARTAYVCADCGAEYPKWQGQCEACGAWNTLSAFVVQPASKTAGANASRGTGYAGVDPSRVQPLLQIAGASEARHLVRIGELDRVLGGGLVEGSVVLVGGDPGIGKSTLLLQALAALGDRLPGLYVSGEESLAQIAARGHRLGLLLDPLKALAETCVERILEHAQNERPRVLVIDSIQTIWTETLPAAPGSVSQVRETAARLVRFAKETGTCVFLVGHVTKEGGIAGPRVLEHMVDTVLYFEGERGHPFRILRAHKNRFGSTNEIGVFEMKGAGLAEVPDPSAMFLSERPKGASGSVVTSTLNGTRPILVEVQALVAPTGYGTARRTAIGVDSNRVALLAAVLEKKEGVQLIGCDIFVNVAGGMALTEPASDLAVCAALVSSLQNKAIDAQTLILGEVGLAGEVRAVAQVEPRLAEAAKMGFKRVILPKGSARRLEDARLQVLAVESLSEALALLS